MSILQDPASCKEDAIYKKKKFTSRPIELPLLLKRKVKTDQIRLTQHINANRGLYTKPEDIRVAVEKDVLLEKTCKRLACPRPMTKISRTLTKFRSWDLAPNRYNIKGRDIADIVTRQTGKKGPFYSGTLRNDASIYGHLKVTEPCGAKTFYDIPSMADLLNRYYNKNKMKFTAASRNKKPYLRFMVNDMVLCWRDPDDPGPADYFPKAHCLENRVSKRIKSKPFPITNFLPNSYVPARETAFLDFIDTSTPGPGRYETIEIACPCQAKLIVEPGIWRRIEIQKRRRFRHLKFKRIKEELYCPCSKVRNIKGHGHTYVFNSKTVRLVQKVAMTKKLDRLEKMHHTTKYIQMIVNPPRIPISLARIDMTPKPATLAFNSIIKKKMRAKLKQNKQIAFLSTTPRFKDDDKPRVVADTPKPKEAPAPKKPILSKEIKPLPEPIIETREDVIKRLQTLPSRYKQKQIAAREKVFTFSPIPAPQLLLKESDMITKSPNAEYFHSSCDMDDYLLEQFRKPRMSSMGLVESSTENEQERISLTVSIWICSK